MKLVSLATLFVSLWFTCLADGFQPEGEPFLIPTNAKVVWGVTVTNLPTALWVYKTIPQNFSQPVIENMLVLCQLTTKNRLADTNNFLFRIRNEKGRELHRLDMIPSQAFIYYENNSSNYKDPLETAPTPKEIEKLALEDLQKAGVDRSLIGDTPKFGSATTTERGSDIAITNAYGVYYVRKVDGIPERGYCFSVNYGTLKGKPNLLQLTLSWRNLVPYKLCSIADANDIIQILKSDLARATQQPNDISLIAKVKKVTITKFNLIYFNDLPREKVDFEYPYAELTVVGDDGTTNKNTFYLNCPIMKGAE